MICKSPQTIFYSWQNTVNTAPWASWGWQKPEKQQLEEHFGTDYVNWQQVSKIFILKRQIFWEVKLDRGCPICKDHVYKFWNNSRKMFFNIILERLWIPCYLQHILSSKDSVSLQKSLCAKEKAENQHWIKNRRDTVMEITAWTLLEITVCEHSWLCHLQIQSETLSCKEAIW